MAADALKAARGRGWRRRRHSAQPRRRRGPGPRPSRPHVAARRDAGGEARGAGGAGICRDPPGSGVAASCVGAPAAFVAAETCGQDARGPGPRWRGVGVGAGILRNPAEGGAWDRGHPARTFARCAMSAGRRGRPGVAGLRGAPAWRRVAPLPPRRRRELIGGVHGGGDVRAGCPRSRAALARGWRRRRHSAQRATPPKAGLGRPRVPACTFARGAMPAGRGGEGGVRCGNLRGSAGLRHGGELRWRRRAEGADFLGARASRPHVSNAANAAGRAR